MFKRLSTHCHVERIIVFLRFNLYVNSFYNLFKDERQLLITIEMMYMLHVFRALMV